MNVKPIVRIIESHNALTGLMIENLKFFKIINFRSLMECGRLA